MLGRETRQPLPVVLINGVAASGVTAVEVQANSFLGADRFSVTAALDGSGAAAWSAVPLLTEVQVTMGGASASLVTGNADSVSIDPIRGEVRVAGRDLAALFVAAQIEESFENQTASEIATLLAGRQGLAAAVTPTQDLVGRYYQTGRTRTALTQHARATTQWDLLCWLAQLENYDVWVSGQTLNFQPPAPPVPALTITPGDCVRLHMHHALDIAAGVTVAVKSWDCVAQSAVTQTASSGSGGVTRTVVRPNLSAGDAQALAAQLVGQISGHERRLDIDMPGDLFMFPRMTIALAGTGTDFDGIYSVCAVERRLSVRHGFVQSVDARSVPWTVS
jgi:hypothetical protein